MKYDAHASALDDAYGMLAELRRELSDTREDKNDREELLDLFASCKDSQRAWILLEDYFNKLKLSRKDFPGDDWWKDVVAVKGKKRSKPCRLCSCEPAGKCPRNFRAREPQAVQ